MALEFCRELYELSTATEVLANEMQHEDSSHDI